MGAKSQSTKVLLLIVGVLVLALAVYSIAGRMAGGSRLEKARSLYEAGDGEKAYRLFEDIYSRQPQSGIGREALYYMCMIGSGPADARRARWEKFLAGEETGERRGEGMLRLAEILQGEEENERAVELYREVIREAPSGGLSARAMHELAALYGKTGNLYEARGELESILEEHPDYTAIGGVQKELGDIGIAMLLSRRIQEPLSIEYVVQKGDSLEKIARRFNTTVDLLGACNNKQDGVIRYNDRLKVVNADFTILIDKSQCTLSLLADGELLKVYSVGTGKDNVTPVGTFKITNKLVEPAWYRPGGGEISYGDPENLLGSRWMGIDSPGYGIHGTWDPGTIGKQASAGCVRLLNEDVEELFMIVPLGTPVTIVD